MSGQADLLTLPGALDVPVLRVARKDVAADLLDADHVLGSRHLHLLCAASPDETRAKPHRLLGKEVRPKNHLARHDTRPALAGVILLLECQDPGAVDVHSCHGQTFQLVLLEEPEVATFTRKSGVQDAADGMLAAQDHLSHKACLGHQHLVVQSRWGRPV